MYKWLYKFVFIAVSFSFFISATDLDLGESRNTFFDEYDTYVQSKEINFPAQTTQITDYYGLCDLPQPDSHYAKRTGLKGCSVHFFQLALPSQKIFLRNSVWRI